MKRILLAVALGLPCITPAAAQTGYPTISPFDGLRWNGDVPDVQLDERWYALLELDGIDAGDILAFCRERYGDKARKRFREDLVQVLSEMGHAPEDRAVDLKLRDLETRRVVLEKRVRMTLDKRQELRRQAARGEDVPRRGAPRRGGAVGRDGDRFARLSPFDGLRWREDEPEVRLSDQWYELVSYDGIDAREILAFCQRTYGRIWKKRFAEDLVQVLAGMGHQAGRIADLHLRPVSGGDVVRRDVAATPEKRNAIRDATPFHDAGAVRASLKKATLTRDQVDADLMRLGRLIEQSYSYRDLRGVDTRAAIGELRQRFTHPTSRSELAVGVMRLLARYGDGHTRVQGSSMFLPAGFTPFAIAPSGDRLVALSADGCSLLDASHPYLTAIDGIPVEQWLDAVSSIVPDGSPQLRRQMAAHRLQSIQFARGELGRDATDSLAIELASADGSSKATRELEVSGRPPHLRSRDRAQRVLQDNVGLIRIPSMNRGRGFEVWLREAMAAVADTDGLILDVRGNGGGSRDALRTLLPYFLSDDAPARVVNVAAFRLGRRDRPDRAEGYLQNRFLYPAAWRGWSAAARRAISETGRDFEPDWKPPSGEFSAWHYMVVTRDAGAPRYDKPVIVLLDGGCYSATDVFLGAFQGLPGVTLMGEASGGGSGRSQSHRLPDSGIELRLSTMASFRPDGTRYDGVGIIPDVVQQAMPTDLTGATDTVLESARQRLAR